MPFKFRRRRVVILVFLLNSSTSLFSQNVFQSNLYTLFQPTINFSSASSYEGINFAGFYRNQWTNFKGAPQIYGANFFYVCDASNSSLGVSLYQDNIGIHQNTEISINYAYKIKLNKKRRLSFSLSPTLKQIKDNYAILSPVQGNDMLLNSNTVIKTAPNIKFGSYFYNEKFYVGFSSPNLLDNNITNSTSIVTNFDRKKINYYLHGGYNTKINRTNSIGFSAFSKVTSGAFLHTELNIMYNFLLEKIGLGIGYKTSNELSAILKIKANEHFTIGYAYQHTLTEINKYISGGHEILLIYNASTPERVKVTPPRF